MATINQCRIIVIMSTKEVKMKKKIPKGMIRCGICNKTFPSKSLEAIEHFKSEEHLEKTRRIRETYEKSLYNLTNFKGL